MKTLNKTQFGGLYLAASVLLLTVTASHAQIADRVTILADAFAKSSSMKLDWGYSALVEYKGKRILFDTGNNSDLFAHNVKRSGIDLKRLDFVVISHRHGDHTAGLHYLLSINPKVRIYSPADEHFGGPTPMAFFERSDPSLPSEMRYFGGFLPKEIPHGSAWKDVKFEQVSNITELIPGIRLVPTTSQVPGFVGLRELSLSIDTPNGQILVVGCSHSGIERILEESTKINDRFRMVFGGLHLVTTSNQEVDRLSDALKEKWKVEHIAPGHCTGEHAFASLRKKFGDNYLYAGVGTAVPFR
jgi:7,8-dihydropterin-6-yl-methyl-4-(beta-D-ribofuranosyl)aminobenzene 5'-phosphate synthase